MPTILPRMTAKSVEPARSTTTGLQGWVASLTSDADKRAAIELAFDYRGDVTLTLNDGEQVVGFLFNRGDASDGPYLEIFPKDEPHPRRIAYSRVVGLFFSGIDAAAGKSWDSWLKKVAQAQAEGKIAELYPESSDE